MGLPVSAINPEAEEARTELYDGEDNLARDFRILFQVALETHVRREATNGDVPAGVVWDAIGANPAANRLLNQLPRLLAQAALARRIRQEEIDREDRRQEILRAFHAREHLRRRREEGNDKQ